MRITFIRSNTNAVGEYRVRHPMTALRRLGHECNLITLDNHPQRVGNDEVAGDLLVLQRQVACDVFALVETLPESQRPRFVYEIDDNPWEWHSWDPVHSTLGYDYGKRVREVMTRCDAITCSTRTLAARVRREFPSKPIWVVPNAIDFDIRDWSAAETRDAHGLRDNIVLGWTGSIHHTRDAGALLEALPYVFRRYPEAVFLMQCDKSVYSEWTRGPLAHYHQDHLRWVPPLPFDVHPMIYSLFDVNLAPLENTPFNRCKSDLRLIEGGAHGVPYVASRIAPYQEFHEQSGGIGGYLAATPGEWNDAIIKLLDAEDVARGNSLQSYVKSARALSVVVGQWEAAFQGVLAGREGEQVGGWSKKPGRNEPCPCGSGQKFKRCCERVAA